VMIKKLWAASQTIGSLIKFIPSNLPYFLKFRFNIILYVRQPNLMLL
jgi:hypothetical protein